MPNVVSPFRVLLTSRFVSFRGTPYLRFVTLVRLFHWILSCVSSFSTTSPRTVYVFVSCQSTWIDQCRGFDGPLLFICCCCCELGCFWAKWQPFNKESLSQCVQAIFDGLHDALIDDGDCRDYFCAHTDRMLHLVARATILWDVLAATAEGIESSLRRAMDLLMSQDKDDSAASAMFLCSGNRGRLCSTWIMVFLCQW